MKKTVYAVTASVMAFTMAMPQMSAYAGTETANTAMRRQVVELVGVLANINGEKVTRKEFARMLVHCSSFRDNLPVSNMAVYSDVNATDENAVYIRIAAEQKWMSGFLGGVFRPDDYITYKDAVHAVLTMLGYGGDDVTGDRISSEISLFNSLELGEKVRNMNENEILDRYDCADIFYNLLKCEKKGSSEIYGKQFGCMLSDDGEINPVGIVKDFRKGPILVRRNQSIRDVLPFGTNDANVFINGIKTSGSIKDATLAKKEAGFAVVYYHTKSKTVWVYTSTGWDSDDSTGKSQYVLLKGELKNIYYKSTDVITPTAIKLEIEEHSDNDDSEDIPTDDAGSVTISLDSTDLQYMFSVYGDLQIGDKVVLVCEGTNESSTAYVAVDAIKY